MMLLAVLQLTCNFGKSAFRIGTISLSQSALKPSTESPRNCRAFLSSATLIKCWNCGGKNKDVSILATVLVNSFRKKRRQ